MIGCSYPFASSSQRAGGRRGRRGDLGSPSARLSRGLLADFLVALGVERIDALRAAAACFADRDQAHGLVGVVDEAVRDAGAVGEARRVARLEAIEVAVDPRVGFALEYVDEFFFVKLGVRIGRRRPGER